MAKLFTDAVYPFTTEVIDGYIEEMDLEGKSLLTVGSSLDQAFNAALFGVGKITVFDINPFTEEFYKLKKDFILKYPRKKLQRHIMEESTVPLSNDVFPTQSLIHMNTYMKNDENYERLRKIIRNDEMDIEFIQGDVFDMDATLKDRKFDRILLSNVLQYLTMNAKGRDSFEFLKENFEVFKSHLNDEGILQLIYYYAFSFENYSMLEDGYEWYHYLERVVETLGSEGLYINRFPDQSHNAINKSSNREDAIIVYKKGR